MKMNIYTLVRRLRTLGQYYADYGIVAASKLALQKLRRTAQISGLTKNDLLSFYGEFVQPIKDVDTVTAAERNTINWFIPPFGKGSGGHLNIFRFIFNLEKLGFVSNIIIVGDMPTSSTAQIKREITDWFFPLNADVFLGNKNAPPAYFTLATGWQTAYLVKNFSHTTHRLYFVQDFEPWFYPMGSDYLFAEGTYRLGLTAITAGDWLKTKLSDEYGMRTHAVGFAYDKHLYHHVKRPARAAAETSRVFFYARPPTQRRGFELGLMVLARLCLLRPGVEVIFAGWDVSAYQIPFKHINAGLLALEDLPALYNTCDAALVISLSNASLLPLELMACGVPVVSNSGAWTEWLLNEHNSMLADATVEGLSSALVTILDSPLEADRIRSGGFTTTASMDWFKEAEKMAALLELIDHQPK